jgi:adenylate cyclase
MSKQTVLLADDDQTTRLVLSAILESQGYQVDTADRGEKCLFLALENTYDALLIDINMPGIGGIDLCKRLRELARYKMVPIIFITSMDEESSLTEAFSVGASDFIAKPVNAVVLAARLKNHLDKKQYYDELERVRHYLNRYISLRTQRMVEAYALTGLLPTPELHHVCVMFSDIRGSTELSRTIDLDVLFARISRTLGRQVDMVYKFNGYIDKFGGDGLMAIFDGEKAVINASRCAQNILKAEKKEPDEPLPIGIGLHYGPVLIGNIGSDEHLDYSALGETVNLASRICEHAKSMQVDMSQQVVDKLKGMPEFVFGEIDTVLFRGFNETTLVHTLSINSDNVACTNN